MDWKTTIYIEIANKSVKKIAKKRAYDLKEVFFVDLYEMINKYYARVLLYNHMRVRICELMSVDC